MYSTITTIDVIVSKDHDTLLLMDFYAFIKRFKILKFKQYDINI